MSPRLPVLCLAAALLAGCAVSRGRPQASSAAHQAKVEAVLAALRPELDRNFKLGPSWGLDQLQALDAANKLGGYAPEAGRLWDEQINVHYRANRRWMERTLRREVSGYRDDLLDDIVTVMDPASRGKDWTGKTKTGIVRWYLEATRTERRASSRAICQSLRSTPLKWAELYPRRGGFRFQRFGIDAPRFRKNCTFFRKRPKGRDVLT